MLKIKVKFAPEALGRSVAAKRSGELLFVADLVPAHELLDTILPCMNDEKRKIDWGFTRTKARLKFNYSKHHDCCGAALEPLEL